MINLAQHTFFLTAGSYINLGFQLESETQKSNLGKLITRVFEHALTYRGLVLLFGATIGINTIGTVIVLTPIVFDIVQKKVENETIKKTAKTVNIILNIAVKITNIVTLTLLSRIAFGHKMPILLSLSALTLLTALYPENKENSKLQKENSQPQPVS